MLLCWTRESSIRRGQAERMGRPGQPYGEPGLHGRCGACPAGGRCELVVGYNGEHQLRTAYWRPALYRGWVAQPEPHTAPAPSGVALRQGRTAEYEASSRRGPEGCYAGASRRPSYPRPKQARLGAIQRGHGGAGSLSGPLRELHPPGIGQGGSGREARAAGPAAKRNSAHPFLRRKDTRRRHATGTGRGWSIRQEIAPAKIDEQKSSNSPLATKARGPYSLSAPP